MIFQEPWSWRVQGIFMSDLDLEIGYRLSETYQGVASSFRLFESHLQHCANFILLNLAWMNPADFDLGPVKTIDIREEILQLCGQGWKIENFGFCLKITHFLRNSLLNKILCNSHQNSDLPFISTNHLTLNDPPPPIHPIIFGHTTSTTPSILSTFAAEWTICVSPRFSSAICTSLLFNVTVISSTWSNYRT